MWQTILQITLKLIPFERIVAWGLNYLLTRYLKEEGADADLARYRRTGQHLTEAIAGFNLALADGSVSPDELASIRAQVLAAYAAWAAGQPTPDSARALLKE